MAKNRLFTRDFTLLALGQAFSLVGNRRRERLIKRFTPMLAVGAFIGGVMQTAAGITAAVFFGLLNALIFRPKAK